MYWKVIFHYQYFSSILNRQILFGYLPPDRNSWEKFLIEKRQIYSEFHKDLIVNPRKEQEAAEEEKKKKQREALEVCRI
jgi:hypothetical protein